MIKSINEVQDMWNGTDKESLNSFIKILCNSQNRTVVGLGAGRMGYAIQSFIMRLSHLGFNSYMIGDTTLPRVDAETIVIVNSSSGKTPSIDLYVEQCKAAKCFIVSVTTGTDSPIAKKSDLVIHIPNIKSEQIMKTIYEQYTFMLFDYIASTVFNKSNLDKDWVEQNHSILE